MDCADMLTTTASPAAAAPLPALREPAVSAWPAGPWDSACASWRGPAAGVPLLLHHPVDIGEDLYPDDDDGLALAAFTTYQYHLQTPAVPADSLLPADSYTRPPPQYPLYNWTLPYGPDRAAPNPPPPLPVPQPRPRAPPEVRVGRDLQAPSPYFHDVFIDDVVEVEVGSSRADGDDDGSSERITFNSVEEALASIEEQELQHQQQTQPRPPPPPPPQTHKVAAPREAAAYRDRDGRGARALLADEKQEEVVKAAKSLFSKRTRTLYHWLFPDTSKTKLKATVSAAWDTLSDAEKQFYLSQVLGRFGLQASNLMVNPQLDGIKGLPVQELGPAPAAAPKHPSHGHGPFPVAPGPTRPRPLALGPPRGAVSGTSAPALPSQTRVLSETDEAVNQLFASCEDSETWTSYDMSVSLPASTSTSTSRAPVCSAASTMPAPTAPRPRSLCGQAERRKRPPSTSASRSGTRAKTGTASTEARLCAMGDQVDEEVIILKRMRDAELEAELSFRASDLNSELDKFPLLARDGQPSNTCRSGEDFWHRAPDPDDIFPQLEF